MFESVIHHAHLGIVAPNTPYRFPPGYQLRYVPAGIYRAAGRLFSDFSFA